MDHHEIAFGDDHSRFISQCRRDAFDEIEQAFASGGDVSAVLDVVGRPEALSCDIVTLIEQRVECLEDKRFVLRFRAWTSDCRRLSKARLTAAIIIKWRIMKLGTKWIRQQAVIMLLVIERIIGVAVGIERVESRAIVRVEGQPEFDALRQVWIRKEMTPERNQVSVSLFDDCFGTIRFKSTRGDDFSFEDLAQLRRRNRRLTLHDEHVAFDPAVQ